MSALSPSEESQLLSTIEMFEVITQSQPLDPQSWDILKEAYLKLGKAKEVIQTSKKLAQVYVQLGQLSSAILEYETILQRHPDDKDVLKALAEIETRASTYGAPAPETDTLERPSVQLTAKGPGRGELPADIDDGRHIMHKIFVEGKHISVTDFNQLWLTPNLFDLPLGPSEPFLRLVEEKRIMPSDKSIRLLSDRTRLAYLPLDKYDVDVDTARSFSKDVCRRWCILPFDKMSRSIFVATANPFNKQAVKDIEAAGKGRIVWYLTSPGDLFKLVQKVFR